MLPVRSFLHARTGSSAGAARAVVTPVLTVVLSVLLALTLAPVAYATGTVADSTTDSTTDRQVAESAPAHTVGGATRLGPRVATVKAPATTTPLAVSIESMTPSSVTAGELPRRGRVRIEGTLTNTDDVAWEDVRVYPFVGSAPMTTSAEIAEAVATPADAVVGERITVEGAYATIPSVPPGGTVSYALSVPRSQLPDPTEAGAEGVYWFGVHALGSNDGGVAEADGRARTFLPVLSRRRAEAPVPTSFVIPLRRRVLRAPDGSVAQLSAWATALSPGGRLHGLLETGASAGGREVTWLVDPAVLDAIAQIARGNPPRDIGPTVRTPSGGPTVTAGPSPTESPSASESAEPDDPETAAAASAATAWLERFQSAQEGAEILALPYGDPDLAALARAAPDLYARARERSAATMAELGLTATPVDAPAKGYLSRRGLALGDAQTPVLMADRAFAGTDVAHAPIVHTDGRRVLVTDTAAASGGTSPGLKYATVPLRQRVLAEAAIRALHSGPRRPADPLLVSMAPGWDPDSANGLFSGLDQPWLDLQGVTRAYQGVLGESTTEAPAYPDSEREAEIPRRQVRTATEVVASGRVLQRVLARNDTVAAELLDDALTGTAYSAREGRGEATERTLEYVESELSSVTLSARRVTLSSASGSFPVTISNDLDQPVRVLLEATSHDVTLTVPEVVEVPARGRTNVLVEAAAASNGTHLVTMALTDSSGERIGMPTSVPVRVAEVSRVIWLFLGIGAALLFGAIAVRLVRRIRASRSGAGADDEDGADEDGADETGGAGGPGPGTTDRTTDEETV